MNCQALDAGANGDVVGIVNLEITGSFKSPQPHDILIKVKSWRKASNVHL